MPTGVAAQIVAADGERRSWREKLAFVFELLAGGEGSIGQQDLVDVAVYLRFLAMGEVRCEEDGQHYRPSHHAKIAQQVHQQLARFPQADNALVLRKIYPWLPSFGPEFTRKEPLTRIRDIAHRNDIPQQLKREIKHTLQNKLHRCAGPEDLVTSAALLQRVSAGGAGYPAEFVEQFRIFHAELQEFFSARSLVEQLDALANTRLSEEAQLSESVEQAVLWLRADAGRGVGPTDEPSSAQLRRLDQLTRLRRALVAQLVAQQAAPAATSDAALRQQLQLADIAAEERSFVVLSELNNALERPGQPDWATALDALALSLDQLALSAVAIDETESVAADLRQWRSAFRSDRRDDLLRLRSVLQRCRRLAGQQADAVLGLFAARVEVLGRALDVPAHAIQAFCEADLRANLLFQLTRLADWLDRQVRRGAELSAWVPLVPGTAGGELVWVERLSLLDQTSKARVIAVVELVEGDETLPERLAGLIVCHELPQLSHLAVRARQGGVPVATVDDLDTQTEVRALVDTRVQLQVREDGVVLSSGRGATTEIAHTPQPDRQIALSRVSPSIDAPIVALQEAPAALLGAKAAALARLQQISAAGEAGFVVPEALVVPLGLMDGVMQQQPALTATYARLVARAEQAGAEELPAVCEQLRSLIRRLSVPGEVSERVGGVFSSAARLMVRSSANCEDLDALAGAGLYDSVANVPLPQVGLAIRRVWASLWSDRAALSRRADGVPQAEAQMAVLVQQMVVPEWSFFLHTVDPLTGSTDDAFVELVVGLGETLAAATRGTPFRWRCSKTGGGTVVIAYPSISEALLPQGVKLRREAVRYAGLALCQQDAARQRVGRRFAELASLLERELGAAQDVEGVLRGEEVFLVQARAQQGVMDAATTATAGTPARPRKKPQRAAGLTVADSTSAAPRVAEGHRTPGTGGVTQLPAVLALFEKRIDGDDALLALARQRCADAGLGIEIHPATPADVDHLLGFRPAPEACVVAHLPRKLDLLRLEHRESILQFARAAAGRIRGFVVHDQQALVRQAAEYRAAAAWLDERLGQCPGQPLLFIEYAVGLEPADFVGFFESVRSLERVSACVDSGHVGIRQLCRAYAAGPGPELRPCTLTPYDERLPEALPALEQARKSCLGVVAETVRALVAIHKPLHFHLHDGHPLWTLSPYGVSDHISFLEQISIPFEYEGRRCLQPLFGPAGLAEIVAAALQFPDPTRLSMTLEIHPVPGRLRLGQDRALFRHWQDKHNAERMNYWLAVLLRNAALLRQVARFGLPSGPLAIRAGS